MTPNRRILLNIVATYGRSVFAIVCGLFTSRWVLMSLGQVDYGLFGVVGVLTGFVGFLNGLLAVSVSRFYAYSVGRARDSSGAVEALEECRRWFNTALLVHTVIPVALMVVGYPIGQWAIGHWLTIPPERIEACHMVFIFSSISCFVSMVNVPFQAMYFAKQYIAELTIYSFFQTAVTTCCLYYMVTHPRDWLVGYAFIVCVIAVVPQLIISLRALRVFPECRFVRRYFIDLGRLPELLRYVGWQAFGLTGQLMKFQGIAILVNKAFGAKVNAAMSVANSVNAHSSTLSSALLSAFTPAITQACGAGDLPQMRRMAFRASKFGVMLVLIFAVPLMVELPLVLSLWLKTPPAWSTTLCIGVLVALLAEKSTYGHMIAMNAIGRIAAYQATVGTVLIFTLPVAYVLVKMGLGVPGVALALVVTASVASLGRIVFAKRIAGMNAWEWIRNLVVPIAVCTVLSGGVGYSARFFMEADFLRLIVSVLLCEVVFIPFSWFLVLDMSERQFAMKSLKTIIARFKPTGTLA